MTYVLPDNIFDYHLKWLIIGSVDIDLKMRMAYLPDNIFDNHSKWSIIMLVS